MNHFFTRALKFTTKSAFEELKQICLQANLNPQKYLIHKDVAGFDYVLDKIVCDLYLSQEPIDTKTRYKLFVLHTIIDEHESVSSLFDLNARLEKEKDSWQRSRIEEKISALIQKIQTKLVPAYES